MENKLEAIYQKITELAKEAGQKTFAVFDFDNTCIVNDIEEAALAYMARNDLFRDKNILSVKAENYSKAIFENYYKLLDDGKIREAYEFNPKVLSGFLADEIIPLVDKVIESEGEKITTVEVFGRKIAKGIKLRKETIKILNFLQNNGVEVWVVSASPEILVRQAMKYFNIEANLIGVRNVIIDGIITSELEKPLPIIEGKVGCIKKFISQNKKPLLGVGDSINDLPMLEYCNMKVVVDMQNAFSAKAKQNNWFLI